MTQYPYSAKYQVIIIYYPKSIASNFFTIIFWFMIFHSCTISIFYILHFSAILTIIQKVN